MRLLVLLLWTWAAGLANAGSQWNVRDLGASRSEAICVAAATRAFQDVGDAFGLGHLAGGDWVAFAYGLGGEGIDAVITCAMAGGGKSRATLALLSDEPVRARIIADRTLGAFSKHNRIIGEAYLEDALRRNGL